MQGWCQREGWQARNLLHQEEMQKEDWMVMCDKWRQSIETESVGQLDLHRSVLGEGHGTQE